MERLPRERYTKEFREETVKLITEEKLSIPEVGRRLNLAPSTVGNWVKAYKAGRLGEVGKTYRPLTEIEMELYRTKKELAEVRMERDILKKPPRTLPRSRCPVRDDERTATPIPGTTHEENHERIRQRVLCLEG